MMKNNMKRTVLTALVLVLCLCLCACGEKTEGETLSLMEKLRSGVHTEGLSDQPADFLGELTGLEMADYTETVYMESSDGMGASCVIALRGKDAAAAENAEKLLENYRQLRMEETRDYLPEEYKLLNSASVGRKGNTVVLVVGGHAAEDTALLLK